MNISRHWAALGLCLTLVGCGQAAPPATETNTLAGRVVAIQDGDTLTVLVGREQQRIRLAFIDAPEKAQAFGQRSRQTLAACAFGKEVTVRLRDRDRYGRLVGVVLANGHDCNLQQIEQGMAWHFTRFAKTQPPEERARYAAAEVSARAGQRGLWRDAHPVPPWDFRRNSATDPAAAEP